MSFGYHTYDEAQFHTPAARVALCVFVLSGCKASKVTGLQTLREYLCMNGRDSVDCDRRTVVTTLTRALLGSWEGSAITVRSNLCASRACAVLPPGELKGARKSSKSPPKSTARSTSPTFAFNSQRIMGWLLTCPIYAHAQ